MKIEIEIADDDVRGALYRSTDNGNGPVCAWASGFSWHMGGVSCLTSSAKQTVSATRSTSHAACE